MEEQQDTSDESNITASEVAPEAEVPSLGESPSSDETVNEDGLIGDVTATPDGSVEAALNMLQAGVPESKIREELLR